MNSFQKLNDIFNFVLGYEAYVTKNRIEGYQLHCGRYRWVVNQFIMQEFDKKSVNSMYRGMEAVKKVLKENYPPKYRDMSLALKERVSMFRTGSPKILDCAMVRYPTEYADWYVEANSENELIKDLKNWLFDSIFY